MSAVLVAVHTVTQDSLHPFINFLHYCSPYSGFYCAEKDNRGRCTDTPSGHHIIWTIGAPTSIIPPFFATTLTIYPGMGQSLNNAGVKWMVKESTHSCPVLPWPLQHIDCTHIHTHTRLTALFQGLPRWAGTRKAKPIWILLKQETLSGSGINWAMCKSAPCSRQTTMPAPHHLVFTGRMPFLPPNHQRQSTKGTATDIDNMHKNFVEIGCGIPEIRWWTDKDTSRQTQSSQYSTPLLGVE